MTIALCLLAVAALAAIIMAAPATTVRQTPAGIALKEGMHTKYAFASDPDISFWEKTTKPPTIDGGEAIDQTTQHNVTAKVQRSRVLLNYTPITFKATYDPAVITQIRALCNVEGAITESFPDGSTLDYFGFLQKAEFDELAEGVLPECTITIVPTNWDPVNNVESLPVLTSVGSV